MGGDAKPSTNGPLHGLKVIDLTRMLPGPFGTLRRPPSPPGQHTHEILSELGMDREKIAELENEGVVKGRTET